VRRPFLIAFGPALLAALALPAVAAAPTVPAPTASATFETVDPSPYAAPPPRQQQPAVTAGWTVAKAGRDGTLKVEGTPVPVFTGHVDALWTSAPLRVARRGAVARLALTWSGVQADPANDGWASQKVSVRFTDGRGRWGEWLVVVDEDITRKLDPGTPGSLTMPVAYRGSVPAKALQLQVKVEDELVNVANINQTVRVMV